MANKLKGLSSILVLLIVSGSSLASFRPEQKQYLTEGAVFIDAQIKDLAKSRHSMVTSAHPYSTNAGLEMLRRGGNAMDAAIAATAVESVIGGGMTSFGGGGQLTFYDVKSNKTICINAEPAAFMMEDRPFVREFDAPTGKSIRVPGSFAGFYLAIKKYGKLPWKEVLEPAIFYAENGFPVTGRVFLQMQESYDILTTWPSGRRIYAPDGFLPKVGDIFKQPELAETLKKVAEHGPDYFYKGAFAEAMVKAIQDIGGTAARGDFASYQALELDPVEGIYKSFTIKGPPPPASGIVSIIEGMNILENVDLIGMGHYSQSTDSLHWIIETLRVILQDAERYTGVPEFDLALGRLLASKPYARSRAKYIGLKIEQMKKQARKNASPGAPPAAAGSGSGNEPHTDHVSTVDKEGNICSFTHTIYGPVFSYAGLFVGGIVLNGAGSFVCQPGERIVTPMAPAIVFKGDRPYFATGSAGGMIQTFFTILNVLAFDKNFKEAQEAPRFYLRDMTKVDDSNVVTIEHRIADNVIKNLKERGYQIKWLGPWYYRNAQIAGIDPETGMRIGASDPRKYGQAAGLE